jgi:Icc-related predicted phosphoesterase
LAERAGVVVLEGDSAVVQVHGRRVGIAGTKGFGGGFFGACAAAFGEAEMKAFVRHTQGVADRFEEALSSVPADVRLALMHYAPVPDTLVGERAEIFPFLGSHLLAEAVDRVGAHLVVHGHAHAGSPAGRTPGGAPVRNVARPLLRSPYQVFTLGEDVPLPQAAAAGLPRRPPPAPLPGRRGQSPRG